MSLQQTLRVFIAVPATAASDLTIIAWERYRRRSLRPDAHLVLSIDDLGGVLTGASRPANPDSASRWVETLLSLGVPRGGMTVFCQSDVPALGPMCLLLGRAVMVRDWGQTISLPAVPSAERRPLTSTLADLLAVAGSMVAGASVAHAAPGSAPPEVLLQALQRHSRLPWQFLRYGLDEGFLGRVPALRVEMTPEEIQRNVSRIPGGAGSDLVTLYKIYSGETDAEFDGAQERWAGSNARAKSEVSNLILRLRAHLISERERHYGSGEVAEVITRSRREVAREADLVLRALHASLGPFADMSASRGGPGHGH